MALRPMLGDIELQQVQSIDTDQEQTWVRHAIPALEGDFFQGMGRRSGRFGLAGVLSGADVGEGLQALREKFRAAEPVPFVSDIASATQIDDVLIEAMEVREISGHPLRFEYAFRLREYLPPPPTPQEPPPIIPVEPPLDEATLIVEVVVEGEPDFDHSVTAVSVDGSDASGATLPTRVLTSRANNVWTEQDMPPGSYTCRATVDRPEPLTGTAQAEVRPGETTRVVITLRPGGVIAKAFVVHFWFDKAFIEPCLRGVLRQVAEHAANHPDEKMVIIGHTDLVGSADYNQSLSERRSRSVYAWLTAGRDRTASIAEWELLRQSRPAGQLPSVRDTWATREYQYILNDLEYYKGNIDEDHGPQTSEAVRAFQLDQGLPQTGQVDSATWSALIAAYLDQDRLAVPESQFFENSSDDCSNGIVKWLGCSERDPVKNTQNAWRPNRRTEILFVRASEFPCEVAQPVTWDLPADGGDWCIGPGDPNQRCCFLARGNEQPDKWLVQPAETERITVNGTVTFEDGSPVANEQFTLLAPDGEYLHTDAAGNADLGERPSGPQRGRPIPDRTGAAGEFSYPLQTLIGTYILELPELQSPAVARLAEAPPQEARGNVVCKRLDGASAPGGFGVVVQAGPQPATAVNPTITLANALVVVKQAHTNPARVQVTLATDGPFSLSGTFTRSSDVVRFFDAASGGNEITFDGTDNVYPGARLSTPPGVQLFAESSTPSAAVDDVQLTLTLAPGSTPVGPPAIATMTAVQLTLDIAEPRTSPGVDPPLLSQTDKVNVGRFVLPQNATFTRERATLVVGQPTPLIATDLELRALNTQVDLFADEDPRSPAPPQTSLTSPHTIPTGTIPVAGLRLFLEGKTASSAFRETGCQLGVAGGDPDGDRVAVTVLGPDPSQPGLFEVGEHEYTEAQEGTFGLPRPGAVDDPSVIDPPSSGTPTFTIRRRAVVRYPADSGGSEVSVATEKASYPLIILLHGNHRRFLDDGTTFVESYRGLEYLARHLASHGYIALTIDVDDINARADAIFHRGAAILEHIQVMTNRNTSGPSAPGQVDFTGKIDLSQIGLIGHSRGGEGVLAAEQINAARSLGHNISGIMSIAPTNFEDIVHNTSPLLVLYGSSDGDVRGSADGVNPFLIYDRAAPPKTMIFVYAAIHNRFSTNADWLDPRFIDNDDARIISEADHQNIAKGYAAAFFERHFLGRLGFDTFFKNYDELASVSTVDLHQQVQDPTRQAVDDYEQPAPDLSRPLLEQLADRASSNTLGQPVSETGLVIPAASLAGAFTSALTEANLTRTFLQFFVHDSAGAMVAWDSSGDLYETTLDGLDASSFVALAFRVTQRLGSSRNPSGAAQDFTVELADTGGQTASVLVSSVTDIPFPFERHDHLAVHGPPPPSPPPPPFVDALPDSLALSKSALKTIRLPLDSFTAANASLNLSSLETLKFIFDQTGSGEIALDDIEFTN